jgi:hypothetical protein
MVNAQPLLAKPLPSASSWRLLVMLSFKSIKKCYNDKVRFPYQTYTSNQSNADNKSAKYKRLFRPFEAWKRFRQVDVLSTLFFNVVLEAIVRRAKLKTTATIFNKQTQLLAYTDDCWLEFKNRPRCLPIEAEAAKIGIEINKQYTKYMIAAENRTILDAEQTVAFGEKNFEVVNKFVYLGALVTPKNDVGFQKSKLQITTSVACENICSYLIWHVIQS